MKASELRIGNWVKCKEQPDGFQIQSHSFIVCERDQLMYEPIHLTEEWLVRFGFENNGYNYWTHSEQYFELRDKHPNYCYCVNCGEYDCSEDIQYVHQLQNLYFALTGEELILK